MAAGMQTWTQLACAGLTEQGSTSVVVPTPEMHIASYTVSQKATLMLHTINSTHIN